MSYDSWKTDPDYGKTHRQLELEDREISWQCENKIHGSCRVKEGKRCVKGDYSNCACDCHEVEYCYTCKGAPCRCDDIYDAWKDRQMERGL